MRNEFQKLLSTKESEVKNNEEDRNYIRVCGHSGRDGGDSGNDKFLYNNTRRGIRNFRRGANYNRVNQTKTQLPRTHFQW